MASAERSHRSVCRGPHVPLTAAFRWIDHNQLAHLTAVSAGPETASACPPFSLQLWTLRCVRRGAHLPFPPLCSLIATPNPLNFPALTLLISLLVWVSPHPLSFGFAAWHNFPTQTMFLSLFHHHVSFFPEVSGKPWDAPIW